MSEQCRQAPTIIRHRANILCRDGWHATVMYSPIPDADAARFRSVILGAEIVVEPAAEAAPVSHYWPDLKDEDYHPYLVRFRQERF